MGAWTYINKMERGRERESDRQWVGVVGEMYERGKAAEKEKTEKVRESASERKRGREREKI